MGKKGEKHVSLTRIQKSKICLFAMENKHLKQNDLKQWAKKTFNLEVDRSTISKIINRKHNTNDDFQDITNYSSKRTRKVNFPELEYELMDWFLRYENQTPISDAMIIEKGRKIADKLGINVSQLSFSNGWINSFKKRNNIKLHKLFGESGSVNPEVIMSELRNLNEKIKQYKFEDVYNFDETALFYRMEPDTTLATRRLEGRKKDKERITLGLCTNANGSHKLPPLIIGKFQSPRCFKGINLQNVGVLYKSSKKAWMNSIIFQEWVSTFDKSIRCENKDRKVLLILDNVSSHTIHGLNLKNVEILFLPKNTTSKLQPLDSGIIASFKRKYRGIFVRYLIDKLEHKDITVKLNILDAIRFVTESWNNVAPEIIQNCWFHSGLIIRQSTEESDITVSEESIEKLAIQNDISELNLDDPMSAAQYLNFQEETITESYFEESSFLDIVTDEDKAEDDSSALPKVSHKDAFNSCQILLNYFEQQSVDYRSQVKLMNDLKNQITYAKNKYSKQTSILEYFIKK